MRLRTGAPLPVPAVSGEGVRRIERPEPRTVEVWIPHQVHESTNTLLRTHFRERRRLAKVWAKELWWHGHRVAPRVPFRRALVQIERRGIKVMDPDNLVGGVKLILDALQPVSRRHPHGLGWIDNDDPESLLLQVSQRRVARFADVGTWICLRELDP